MLYSRYSFTELEFLDDKDFNKSTNNITNAATAMILYMVR